MPVDTEGPWMAKRRGEGLNDRGLAGMVRGYKTSDASPIRSKTVRVGNETARGYALEQFADAFDRYIPRVPGDRARARSRA